MPSLLAQGEIGMDVLDTEAKAENTCARPLRPDAMPVLENPFGAERIFQDRHSVSGLNAWSG